MSKKKFNYGYWRTDKPADPGFSQELISSESEEYCRVAGTDLETLEGYAVPGVDTVFKALQMQVKEVPTNRFLGTRVGDSYKWMSFKEVADDAEDLSYGYLALDMVPAIQAEDKEWRFLGIQSKNRAEWLLTHFANIFKSVTTVALYDTLGVEAIKYCVDQTEMTTVAGTMDCLRKLADLKAAELGSADTKLHRVVNGIVFGVDAEHPISSDDQAACSAAGIKLHTISEVLQKGKEYKAAGQGSPRPPAKDDCLALSYTSGTTGVPKGVKLTHKMVLGAAYAVNVRMANAGAAVGRNDCYVSYLPAAHSFEQALVGCAC